MLIVKLNTEKKTLHIPDIGYREIQDKTIIDSTDKLGIALKKYFPSLVIELQKEEVANKETESKQEDEATKIEQKIKDLEEKGILTENPIEQMKVEQDINEDLTESNQEDNDEQDSSEKETESLPIRTLESFNGDKNELEVYGLDYGINLKKTKTINNMYNDLLKHIEENRNNSF